MATLKGLPLAYARDLQEDKAAAFEAADIVVGSMAAMQPAWSPAWNRTAAMRRDAESAETTAVDLAEALVRDGVPFREAHAAVAAAVRLASSRGTRLVDLEADELAAVHPARRRRPLRPRRRRQPGRQGHPRLHQPPASATSSPSSRSLCPAARSWSTGFRPTLDLGIG